METNRLLHYLNFHILLVYVLAIAELSVLACTDTDMLRRNVTDRHFGDAMESNTLFPLKLENSRHYQAVVQDGMRRKRLGFRIEFIAVPGVAHRIFGTELPVRAVISQFGGAGEKLVEGGSCA